jgi:hypothetical protein
MEGFGSERDAGLTILDAVRTAGARCSISKEAIQKRLFGFWS